MKVEGIDNLFCAGEKSGLFVGHTEAICTGVLAGYNSVRLAAGSDPREIPGAFAVGDIISYENKMKQTHAGLRQRYTFAGAGYFERMKELGLYSSNNDEIRNRVEKYQTFSF